MLHHRSEWGLGSTEKELIKQHKDWKTENPK